MQTRKMTWALMTGALLMSCAGSEGSRDDEVPDGGAGGANASLPSEVEVRAATQEEGSAEITDAQVGKRVELPPQPAAQAPDASPRLPVNKSVEALTTPIESYFNTQNPAKLYVQTDKPLYRPGESIWVRGWSLYEKGLRPGNAGGMQLELISPKGAVVLRKAMRATNNALAGDFELPAGVPGGEYKIRMRDHSTGASEDRPIMVSAFEAPRIKKKLNFVHKAYGPGDEVSATLEVKRATGEALANKAMVARARLDGVDLDPVRFSTNQYGGAIVRLTLPKTIARGDALLTIMIDDGGSVESISRRIPIVLKKVDFKAYPEGGDLIEGLPGRVYFEARNTIGKAADVKGRVVDDQGREVTTFASVRDGMGRFELTPQRGRRYQVEITSPVGIKAPVPLPEAKRGGCALRSYDDYDGQSEALRVGVRCTKGQEVIVTAVHNGRLMDIARVKAGSSRDAVVHLKHKEQGFNSSQGVSRVTVWDSERNPLAERLVFRNRRNGLRIDIEPDKQQYGPRDQVALTVKTTDHTGEPVAADVAISVVDDTVISFADDKSTGHMLSRLLLEQHIQGKLDEPKFYFDLTEKKSAQGLDLVMGTRGWRRFAWQPVLNPPPPPAPRGASIGGPRLGLRGQGRGGGGGMDDPRRRRPRRAVPAPPAPRADANEGAAPPQGAAPPPGPAPQQDLLPAPEEQIVAAKPAEPAEAFMANQDGVLDIANERVAAGEAMPMDHEEDKDWAGAKRKRRAPGRAWVAARVFPVPDYEAGYEGPRTDFRDTIYWNPQVRTDAKGQATVSFPMSDAVTSFRVSGEGMSAGMLGRKEKVIKSSLPFSMAVKLPLEVSAGDDLKLPLTLSNDRDEAVTVEVEAEFGDALGFGGAKTMSVPLEPGARKTLLWPAKVVGANGETPVRFTARAGQLSDDFTRTMRIVPPGFPQAISHAGALNGKVTYEVDLGEAIPGSVEATVKFYPSPVATMVAGLEGMLRQPGGCFEQASSTNYPNLMVMRYLKEHNIDKPELWQRSGQLMDQGYKLLTGYESKSKGYEWFGQNPGHEALTAYGLMEFKDMQGVWNGVDGDMIERTASWLKSRRDGKGGFERNSKALDSFGRASKEVTDGYITYALTEAGFAEDFGPEIDAQAKLAASTKDPYLLAMAVNTLFNSPNRRDAALKAAARLVKLQDKEGAWSGAAESITRSGGDNLTIETTALAIMALLKSESHMGQVRGGVEWLNEHRSGYGQWGATQATVLSLKAMTQYASATKKTRNAGSITILVNGTLAQEVAYKEGHQDTLVLNFGEHLTPGANKIEIIHESKAEMPFSAVVAFTSRTPATSPEASIDLKTELEREAVSQGEVVRLTATLTNTTDKGQPMTLARVGLPGGLTFQLWQLKELREKGVIGFFETQPREVILYLRDMRPNEVKEIPLDLVATVPGKYEAPASSAYLYYTDEHKTWRPGMTLTVE